MARCSLRPHLLRQQTHMSIDSCRVSQPSLKFLDTDPHLWYLAIKHTIHILSSAVIYLVPLSINVDTTYALIKSLFLVLALGIVSPHSGAVIGYLTISRTIY